MPVGVTVSWSCTTRGEHSPLLGVLKLLGWTRSLSVHVANCRSLSGVQNLSASGEYVPLSPSCRLACFEGVRGVKL